MAYQALYRKYRPHSFDDFIDQDNVKKILVNSIINDKITHAYLFSGPRGIGKTSMAKIFAKAINCSNFKENDDVCEQCDNCKEANENSVDIIEIDAASNNGVDQIRDLKNKISIVPSILKYKVYIIDEVHMLTNSAFNALLKTLEEPPSHVVFILATTEFYEVPETIVSRCQCFSFSRIKMSSLERRLRFIADNEKIDIDDDAIKEIAHFSNGGLRDAIGMLDKIHSFTNEKITVDIFKNLNGMISLDDIEKFYNSILSKDLANVLKMIDNVDELGYDFKNFIERTMLYVRDKVIEYYISKSPISGSIADNIELIETLNDVLNRLKDAVNPIVVIQIYLLKYIENIEKNNINIEKSEQSDFISREIKIDGAKDVDDSKKSDKIISREIISNQNLAKEQVKIVENGQHFVVNLKNKEIRINNAMATANKNYKNELVGVWSSLNKYFMDDKYGKVAQLLSDTDVMVVGTNYAIFTTLSDALINNIYQNLFLVEEFINKIYHSIAIVVVLNSEFERIKNKYIEDKKNKIEYQVQEECGKLIEEENNLINQAIDLFGADMVEIE